MALVEHARLAILIDQTYLVEMTSIEMVTNSGQQRVDTLEGLAGFSPGSGDVSVSGNFAIPIGGTEYPFQENCTNGVYTTVQIPIGAKNYVGTGKFMDVNVSQSVNGSVEGSFNWTGELKPIE